MNALRKHWKAFAVTAGALVLMGAVTITTFFNVAEIAAPALSALGFATMYPDGTSHTWRVSNNNGAYKDILTGAPGATGVTGTGVSNRVTVWNGTSTVSSSAGLIYDGTNLAVGDRADVVEALLDVDDTANHSVASGLGTLNVQSNAAVAAGGGGVVTFRGKWFNGTPLWQTFASILGGKETAGDGTSNAGYFSINTFPSGGTMTERVRVSSTGMVGIGTSGPNEPLAVAGPIFVSSGTPNFLDRGIYFDFDNTSSTGHITTFRPAVGYENLVVDSGSFTYNFHNPGATQKLSISANSTFGTSAAQSNIFDYGMVGATSIAADATTATIQMSCGTASTNFVNGKCKLEANDDTGSGLANYRPMVIDGTNIAIRTDPSTLTGKTHLDVGSDGNVGINTEAQTQRFQVNNAMTAGTGTLASAGTAVTGTGTLFTSELHVGDTIKAVSSGSFGVDYRAVTVITDNLHLTVANAFGANLSGAAFEFNSPVFTASDTGAVSIVRAGNSFNLTSIRAGTCTLNGAVPSTCTATVVASTKCTCSSVGATAAIAAAGCDIGLSGTTLTITSAAAATNDVNYLCVPPNP